MSVTPRTHARPIALHARAWAWLLVALVLLKAAVPLLATAAAVRQGVALAEVCSVYGVRVVAIRATNIGTNDPAPAPGVMHADGEHCTLGSLLGGPAPALLATVPPHPPAGGLTVAATPLRPLPRDASQRWLMARLHAPPVRA